MLPRALEALLFFASPFCSRSSDDTSYHHSLMHCGETTPLSFHPRNFSGRLWSGASAPPGYQNRVWHRRPPIPASPASNTTPPDSCLFSAPPITVHSGLEFILSSIHPFLAYIPLDLEITAIIVYAPRSDWGPSPSTRGGPGPCIFCFSWVLSVFRRVFFYFYSVIFFPFSCLLPYLARV